MYLKIKVYLENLKFDELEVMKSISFCQVFHCKSSIDQFFNMKQNFMFSTLEIVNLLGITYTNIHIHYSKIHI